MNTTTLNEVLQRVSTVKPISRRQLFRYLQSLKIRPVGRRTIPRLYPADTADRIMAELGLPTMAQLADLRRRSIAARKRPAGRRQP